MKKRRLKKPIRMALKAILYIILALFADFLILYKVGENTELALPILAVAACIACNAFIMWLVFGKKIDGQCPPKKKEGR